MTELRARVVSDLDELDAAIVELLEALRCYRATCVLTRDVVARRDSVETAFVAAHDVRARSTVSDALLGFERVRFRSRMSLIALSQQEGLPKARLAELLDVSRQLATRWVKESRPLLDDASRSVEPSDGSS